MRSLINDNDLVCYDDVDVSDIGYTFYNVTTRYKSYIGYMFISTEYKQYINSVEVVDSDNSLPDHLPVKMSIKPNVMDELNINNANYINNHCSNYVCRERAFKERNFETCGRVLMKWARLNISCMEYSGV